MIFSQLLKIIDTGIEARANSKNGVPSCNIQYLLHVDLDYMYNLNRTSNIRMISAVPSNNIHKSLGKPSIPTKNKAVKKLYTLTRKIRRDHLF